MPTKRGSNSLNSTLQRIRMVVMDVDGVMTDGKIIFGSDGTEYRNFHAHDGYGITRALNKGLLLAMISGKKSSVVELRAKKLGIKELYQNSDDKVATFIELKVKYGLLNREVCYIGDDEFDIPLLNYVGFSVAPKNALAQVRSRVDYVTQKDGGDGAVREVLDMILRAKKFI